MSHTRLLGVQSARPVEIVGVACGVGAQNPLCSSGPDALRAGDLLRRLQAHGRAAAWGETIRTHDDRRVDALDSVAAVCDRLARRVRSVVARGRMPLVIGGDHSCAIGTWKGVASALRARGPLGLIWIDAHMDAHTDETTPSGALHGMPLACLLGYGSDRLTRIAGDTRILPEHVCLIGVRSFESGEAELLQRLGVRIFFMPEVEQRGLAAVMREALAIATMGTAGFGVTLDLDAIDPAEAPGVGSPVGGGLGAAELTRALAHVHAHAALAGVEIAEYNPQRDHAGMTGRLAVEMAEAMLAADAAQTRASKGASLAVVKGSGRLRKAASRPADALAKAA